MAKATMKKKVSRIAQGITPAVAKEPKAIRLHDVQVANAIKVGVHQLLYLSKGTYDIELLGETVAFRRKDWSGNEMTVYTTLANVIFWRAE